MSELPAAASTTLVVPTELERGDAFADGAVLAAVALGAWWLALNGLFGWSIPFMVCAAVWTLSGEAVADVPFLGALAVGLRSRLGLRRAHEWVLAWAHYFLVRRWPRWQARWPLLAQVDVKDRPMLRAVLAIYPTTNYAMASPQERSDEMKSLVPVLMALSHRVQLIGQARQIQEVRDWPRPPQLERRWLVVVRARDEVQLAWRVRTLKSALEGVGLRCEPCEATRDARPVTIHSDGLQVGEQWCASVVLRRWPRQVAAGWLGRALAGDLPVDVGIHVLPQDAQRVARFLKNQQAWQTEVGPRQDAANQLGKRDAEVERQKLIARTDRPVKVAVVLTVWASNRDELRQRVQTLGHVIGLTLGDVRLAKYEQDYGREATEPTGRCRLLGVWRMLDCESVASTWIMQPGTVLHQAGAEVGTSRDGEMLVKLDPFDPSLESFGGVVIAKVGTGKSFFLKLLARRLKGVELLIVEQRTPGEYGGIPGAKVLNLADVVAGDRARVLREWIEAEWEDSKAHPRPKLLILDELWSLLRSRELAELVEEIARIGRHYWLALWIATQQVRELLTSGQAVLDNTAVRIYLKQHDRDLDALADAVGLSPPARRYLRGAARGQALLDCGGMLVAVDIQASAAEHAAITTDPRERERLRHGRLAGVGASDRDDRFADLLPTVSQSANGAAGGAGHLRVAG